MWEEETDRHASITVKVMWDQGRPHYEILLAFLWSYYSFLMYTVYLPLGSIMPNQKDSWGSRLFLLSKAIASHLLKDSTPQLSSQGQKHYISRSEWTIWKKLALWCALFSSHSDYFQSSESTLASFKSWYTVNGVTRQPSKRRAISKNLLPLFWITEHVIIDGWVNNHFCQFKAKF